MGKKIKNKLKYQYFEAPKSLPTIKFQLQSKKNFEIKTQYGHSFMKQQNFESSNRFSNPKSNPPQNIFQKKILNKNETPKEL